MILNFDNISRRIIIFLLILLNQIIISNCIINNGNILSDGKWKCYNKAEKKVCYRNVYYRLLKRFQIKVKTKQHALV